MKGLELSKKFYNQFGAELLSSEFSDILKYLAVGFVGSGSECLGLDDDISRDHDFEPSFCIFIPDESIIDSRTEFRLERAYAKLPKEFMGYKRSIINPVGGNRHGVIRTAEFYKSKVGASDGELSIEDWFNIPEYSLLEATNGEVFFDNFGEFSAIRTKLKTMPSDVALKKLAGHLLVMAQSGLYNFKRSVLRGENAAAQLCLYEFCKSAMNVAFLLNGEYMPYYKWSFPAMRGLPLLSELYPLLEGLISKSNDDINIGLKSEDISLIFKIIRDTFSQKYSLDFCKNDMEAFAYSVNDMISDPNIRNLNIFYAV